MDSKELVSATEPICPKDPEQSGCWINQHDRFVHQSKEKEPDVVLLGDSILLNFQFSQFYKNCIEPLHILNFCIHGDQTQNIIWRINNGEFDGLNPKVIVLNVGSHNIYHTAMQIFHGVECIVKILQKKLPNTHIIILGLLPCGREPNPKRIKHAEFNRLLTSLAQEGKNLTVLCPDANLFVQSDGKISHLDMYDYIHPTDHGYDKLGDILLEDLQMVLKTFIKTNAPA